MFDCICCGEEYDLSLRSVCDNCGESFNDEHADWCNGEDGYCVSCSGALRDDSFEEREHTAIAVKAINPNGKILKSKRGFGVEIECLRPYDFVLDNLPKTLGIHEDGSLPNRGIEYVTPILYAKQGERYIQNICKRLNQSGHAVNTACGLHIHLSADDFFLEGAERRLRECNKLYNLKTLWAFYMSIDDVLRAMLPASRRRNRFCRALNAVYSAQEIENISNIHALERMWYQIYPSNTPDEIKEINQRKGNHHDSTRYYGINFHSLLKDGHLEIRYHSGTLQAEKILHWLTLHLQILDNVSSGKIGIDTAETMRDCMTLTDKIKKLFELADIAPPTKRYLWKRLREFTPSLAEEGALKANKVR